jgi:hypothetical protein
MDEDEKQKYISEVENDRAYNLETLDSSLLRYSAVGAGLLPCIYKCMYDQFHGSFFNIYFVLGISFLVASMLCQLLSFEIAVISQNYYLLFFCESDRESKLKAFRRFEIFHYISIFLRYVILCSFALGCIFGVVMLWGGLYQ